MHHADTIQQKHFTVSVFNKSLTVFATSQQVLDFLITSLIRYPFPLNSYITFYVNPETIHL